MADFHFDDGVHDRVRCHGRKLLGQSEILITGLLGPFLQAGAHVVVQRRESVALVQENGFLESMRLRVHELTDGVT